MNKISSFWLMLLCFFYVAQASTLNNMYFKNSSSLFVPQLNSSVPLIKDAGFFGSMEHTLKGCVHPLAWSVGVGFGVFCTFGFVLLIKNYFESINRLARIPLDFSFDSIGAIKEKKLNERDKEITDTSQSKKKNNVIPLAELPTFPHKNNNCWLNAVVWTLFVSMPELIQALLDDGSTRYKTVSYKGRSLQDCQRVCAYANAFISFVCAINSKNVTENDALLLQKSFQAVGPLGMGSAGDLALELLGSLEPDSWLWSVKERAGKTKDYITSVVSEEKKYITSMGGGASVYLEKPEDFEKLIERHAPGDEHNFKYTTIGSVTKIESFVRQRKKEFEKNNPFSKHNYDVRNQLLKRDELTFVELGPYLIISLAYLKDSQSGGPSKIFFARPFTVPAIITVEPWVTQKLKEKMKKEEISFEYELIATTVHKGWSHYVAYYVKDKNESYCFDDLKTPQCNVVTKKIEGPFNDGSYPELLVYRRKGGGGVVSILPEE